MSKRAAKRRIRQPEAEGNIQSRIRELKDKVRAVAGESVTEGRSADLDPELEEQFWKQVLDYETAEFVSIYDLLIKSGVEVPPPDQLDDAQLPAKLTELFKAMELLGAYLHSTDHLSDRELYEYLWNECLRHPTFLRPDDPDYGCHFDLVSTGSEEHIRLWLMHYADEEDRDLWQAEFPDYEMPEHVDPPYDRDRHLPTHDPCRPRVSRPGSSERPN